MAEREDSEFSYTFREEEKPEVSSTFSEEEHPAEREKAPAWEAKGRKEREDWFEAQIASELSLKEETKKKINEVLKDSSLKEESEFYMRFLADRKKSVEKKFGFPWEEVQKMSTTSKWEMARQMGAEQRLKSPKYKKTKERLDWFDTTREYLQLKQIPIEVKISLLSFLEVKYKEAKEEFERVRAAGDRAEVRHRREELDNLFQIRKELAQSITGKELKAERGKRKEEKKEEIDKLIGSLVGSPEEAAKRIRKSLQSQKEELAREEVKRQLRQKKGAELQEIRKQFGEKGFSAEKTEKLITGLIDLAREVPEEKWDKIKQDFQQILRKEGIPVRIEAVDEGKEKMKEKWETIKGLAKRLKQAGGWLITVLMWFIGLSAVIIGLTEEKLERMKK